MVQLHRIISGPDHLINWVVYAHPKDFPDHFVLRPWLCDKGTVSALPILGYADTLEEVRTLIPPGLARFLPSPSDDPCIAESWL